MSFYKNRLQATPRSRYRHVQNIQDLPYGFFDNRSGGLKSFARGGHQRVSSETNRKSTRLNSVSPEPASTGYRSEILKAINFLKKTPIPKPNKIESDKEENSSVKSLQSFVHNDEIEIKKFIEALFSKEQSVYRKTSINTEKETVNLVTADKILNEAKKIIKKGLKKKSVKYELGGNIEDFWVWNINKLTTVRWDIFEDNLMSFIQSYMITDLGIVRKVNWTKFLSRLCAKISKETSDYSLWVQAPCYEPSIKTVTRTISLNDWSSLALSQELVLIMFSCIDEVPSFHIKKIDDSPYTYACGCVYKGQWNDYKRNGVGKLTLCSKEKYLGTFNNGKFHDYGTLKGLKCLYKGYFNKDMFHGFGKILYPDKSYFEGIIEKGKLVNGLLKWSNGKVYKGELNNNEIEGKGVLELTDGTRLQGMWYNGKLHGDGEIKSSRGTLLKGVFINGLINGKGKYVCEDYKYSGEFIDSVPTGLGKFLFTSGNYYKGEVKNGKVHGFGTMKFQCGDFYKGDFINGVVEGQGKYTFSDGKVYEGNILNNLFQGFGVLKIGEGYYRGGWTDGKPDGSGEIKDSSGNTYTGSFAKGIPTGQCELDPSFLQLLCSIK
jgi:hypothetical protein